MKQNEILECKWVPDGSFIPVIEEMARSQGLTVNQVAQNAMDYAVSQGWIYALAPGTMTTFFSFADYQFLGKLLGREIVSGADTANLVRKLLAELTAPEPGAAVPEAVETPEDPAVLVKRKK